MTGKAGVGKDFSMQIHKLSAALWRPTHSTVLQVPRALLVSAIAAGLDCLVLWLLVGLGHWPRVTAATVSYLLGGVVQYLLCSCWVFPTAPRNAVTGFTTFTLLSLVGLAITDGVIWLLSDRWSLHLALAKGAALALAFVWNFSSRKYLLFRQQCEDTPPAVADVPQSNIPVS